MPRYRRLRLSASDSLAATAFSIAVGAGTALATWYVTRLLLSRDELDEALPAGTEPASRPALASGGANGEED